MKFWLTPLPGFNEKDFPYIVCSGWKSYNIINVDEMRMEVLIAASGKNVRSQEAAVIIERKDGFEFHFPNHNITDENKRLENWYCMNFKQDFIENLKQHRRLPIALYKETLKLVSDLQYELEKVNEENRQLKEFIANMSSK